MLQMLKPRLCVALFVCCALTLSAQDAPGPDPEPGRIVESRPPLYSFKRAINPLTWVEAAIRPLGVSAERGFINKFIARKPGPDKAAGVKVKLTGMGSGSGFGPEITPYHENLLGRGIEV